MTDGEIMNLNITTLSLIALASAAAGADPWDPDAVERRIEKHRTAEAAVTVLKTDGTPLAHTDVTAEMVRHRFLFGCNIFTLGRCGSETLDRRYGERFAALHNFATLPFYWGSYERKQGETIEPRIRKAAEWCRARGIRPKGHPLCWHTVEPRWIRDRDAARVEALQLGRITRDVTGFRGLIDTWDVVNEACVMPRYTYKGRTPTITKLCKQLGRTQLVKKCFDAAVRANPGAMLLLNDFNTGPPFAQLIEACLAAGVRIDAIGLQSHMHTGYRGGRWGWEVCERFARFNKPLHFTELTILSGDLKKDNDWLSHHPGWETHQKGERRQAEQAVEFYRLLFSHPAVAAITWWDFSDRGAWQGAPAGLVRKDMSPKPAYEELMKLIKGAWWTGPRTRTTDAAGKIGLKGFLGTYRLSAGGREATVELQKDTPALTVKLR